MAGAGCSGEEGELAPLAEPDLAVASLAEDRAISLDEARERIGWQSAAADLENDLDARLGDRFGGVWIDPSDDDRVKVAVVGGGDETDLWAEVDARGLGTAVDTVVVEHSFTALRTAAAAIGADLARLNQGAAWPLTVSLRTDQNAVMLSLPAAGELSAGQEAYVSEATRAYSDALRLDSYQSRPETLFCRYPHCSPPLRGGVAIYNDVGSAIGKCTSAFVVRSRSDQKPYLMTAGHCIRHVDDDAWWTRWSNRNHTIGAAHNSVFGFRGDMAILNINRPGIMKPGACVMVTSGPETTADFKYGISSDGPVVIGQRVCATGASLGHSDCGTVNATGVTVTYSDGTTVSGLARSNLCVIPGDSGGPVFASHRAHGIISGRDGICSTLHQGIGAAENALNVDVAHGDCP